jgi:hypothetical protein
MMNVSKTQHADIEVAVMVDQDAKSETSTIRDSHESFSTYQYKVAELAA